MADEIHLKRYDYSKFKYLYNKTKSTIICKAHGKFKQSPSSHLEGKGCPICGGDSKGYSKESFINRAEGKNCCLYIIYCYNEAESFYKVGITKKCVQKRYPSKTSMPYSYEIIFEYISNAENVWKIEKEYNRKLKKYNYFPLIIFPGKTECYSINPQELNKYETNNL